MAAPSRPSRVEQVYEEIKRRIVGGTYPPGEPLSESELSRHLRTSRTPVREALSRLLEEGYVERVPGRGYSVTPVTLTLVQNVFEVRRLLETGTAARAAELCDATAITRLRQLADVHFTLGDAASYREAESTNARFHIAVAEQTRNSLLVELVRHCLSQEERFRALGMGIGPLQETAGREHHEIVDAIERHDPAAAREAVARHLDHVSRLMMEALVRGEMRAVRL